jgi:hypothetical protein
MRLIGCLCLAIIAIASSQVIGQSIELESAEVHFSQSADSSYLRAPVYVNGRAMSFIVDTGCTYNLIDQQHRSLLLPTSRQVQIRSIGGTHKSLLYSRNAVKLSNVFDVKSDLLTTDLDQISGLFSVKLDGCLGMNTLRTVGFGFDGDRNHLYFGRNNDRQFDISSELTWSKTQTPLTKDILIDGFDQAFEIDTGAGIGLSVPPDLFTKLEQSKRIDCIHTSQSSSTYGIHSYRSGRLASAKIWGIDFQNIPVNDSSHPRIGLDVLRKFDFYFDFPNNRLLLQSTSRTAEPFQFDCTGLRLTSSNNQIVVYKVEPSSPASTAGIVADDVIVSINDASVQRTDLERVRSLMYGPPFGEITIQFRRKNQTYFGTIRLKDYQKAAP